MKCIQLLKTYLYYIVTIRYTEKKTTIPILACKLNKLRIKKDCSGNIPVNLWKYIFLLIEKLCDV